MKFTKNCYRPGNGCRLHTCTGPIRGDKSIRPYRSRARQYHDLRQYRSYKDSYKAQDYAGAYEPWKAVLTKAPCAEVSTYAYGAMILANVLVKEPDLTKKKAYFQELMDMYDTRLKNLDALNSFTKPDKRATKGDILARKAFDYAYYGAGVADGYSLDKAYTMFREGIDLLIRMAQKRFPVSCWINSLKSHIKDTWPTPPLSANSS